MAKKPAGAGLKVPAIFENLVNYEFSFSPTEGDSFISSPAASVRDGFHAIFNICKVAAHGNDFCFWCRNITSSFFQDIYQADGR